ncbi:MAG: hypothetical protein WC662_02755 [Candidatus Paceibacterota bacterium]|jgi:hypothetical protein
MKFFNENKDGKKEAIRDDFVGFLKNKGDVKVMGNTVKIPESNVDFELAQKKQKEQPLYFVHRGTNTLVISEHIANPYFYNLEAKPNDEIFINDQEYWVISADEAKDEYDY